MSQKRMILNHLLTGYTITPLEAYFEYGTLSLQYHIFRLRQEGYLIKTTMKTSLNNKRYATYQLVKEEAEYVK